ncbi:MAG TPA: DUF47 family protein [Candidatus Acidoferrales bacterium]|nr:DUF47 family protein [Candidatus Acidoferrales bacterium]
MPGLLRKILPREEGFHDMFVELAENVCTAAKAMVAMLEDFSNPTEDAERIKDLEHANDTITHNLMKKLNQTFITPFDREDIHELASKIDDVLDLTDAAASRLVTYRIERIRPGVIDLARSLKEATEELVAAVKVLEKRDHVLDHCIEINRLENEADRQCRTLIANLFEQEKDPVQIIKWKEIIEVLEIAADKCEDVANVIETITLKNA